jgi:hypothetical protein
MSGMWISTVLKSGQFDHFSLRERAEEEKCYAMVYLTNGNSLSVEEDFEAVAEKIQKATK